MSNYIEYNDKMAFHPGYYIKEIIEDQGITQEDFAKRLDTTPKNLSLLIRGEQNLSIDIATKLSRMLDTSIIYWLNLQNAFDALKAESISDEMIEQEREVFKELDYDYFCDYYGFSRNVHDIDTKIKFVRQFLKVSSLKVLDNDNLAVCFRSESGRLSKADRIKANTMVQIATNSVLQDAAPKFNKKKFSDAVEFALTQTGNCDFYMDIKDAFLKTGVKLVVIPNLSNSKTNGATKKIGDSIMLMVNDRETYVDSFWFTMFHEIGHIMLGDFGISIEKEDGEAEKTANEYARNKLIPNDKYDEFIQSGDFSDKGIKSFAKSINRDPGIVAGRLIHDEYVKAEDKDIDSLRKKLRMCRY